MKVLITGVDGFVGTHLSNYLLKQEITVYGTTVLDNYKNDRIKVYKMDLLNEKEVNNVIKEIKPDKIFHLAGQSAVGLSWQKPVLTIDINVNGTLHLLEAVKNIIPETKVLVVGSSDQYGVINPEDIPVNENKIQNPQSPYGISKKTQEEFCKLYIKAYNMNIIMVRPFNHIGAGQGKNFVVSDFASKIVEIEKGAEPILKVGNLETFRDFTDVRDIVRGYHLLLEKGKIGEVYNIGAGKKVKIREILEKLKNMSKIPIKIEIDSDKFRPVDVPIIVCDNSKITEDTGWIPKIPINDTLKETLSYWRNLEN